MKTESRPHFFRLLLAAYCLLLTTGCVRRQLTIKSEPPGATILLNDRALGTTPYSDEFEWYGSYRLTLTKEGYERLDDRVTLRAPWYLWIPMDLATEALPLQIRDARTLSYTLREKEPLPTPVPPFANAQGGTLSESERVPPEYQPPAAPEETDGDTR